MGGIGRVSDFEPTSLSVKEPVPKLRSKAPITECVVPQEMI